MSSLETIDYIFILIVVLSTLFGLARGFLREAFTLANIFLAAAFTYFFYPYSYEFFARQLTNETMIAAASVFLVFIVFWIIIAIINSFIIDSLGKAKGSRLDRLLGMALGLLRGMLIVISIYLGVAMGYKAQNEEKNMPEWLSHAKTYNFVKMQSEYFLDVMPEGFRTAYEKGSGELTNTIIGTLTPIDQNQRKLLDYGLTLKNVQTLKTMMEQLPFEFDRNTEFRDLSKLDAVEFKNYANNLIEDYSDYLQDGRIKPTIPKQDVDSLRKSIAAIEETQNEDLYKGEY